MKVLLISPNAETRPYPVYPLGLDYVAGAIKDRHQIWITDINEPGGADTILARVKQTDPDIIGISIRNVDTTDAANPGTYLSETRDLVEKIRKISQTPIIIGGSGLNMFPRAILSHLGADYALTGEGERLAAFLDRLSQNKPVTDLPGVITPDNRAGALTPPAPLNNLAKRSFLPDRPHVDYYLRHGGMLNLQTKRGCCFQCIYCTYPDIEGRRMRLFDPAEVARQARQLQDAGAGFLFVTDSAFNADPDHSLAVARAFARAQLTIPWGAYIAPARMPKGYFSALAKAGMTHAEFGTDAFCDPILAQYRKPFTCADIFAAHEAALDAGIYAAHFFLLGAPGESEKTLETTLDNAAALKKTACFFFTGIRIYPGTRVRQMAVEEGQIRQDADLFEPVFYRPEQISAEQIQTRVTEKARNRINWIVGSGGDQSAQIISRLHSRGHTGPLWEYLVR
ncbi:MAG: cobalamin-dependent protein [Desulfobacterales bacterium]|nr:cobalamin-dependent protein [Desulfobacterales bacterium]